METGGFPIAKYGPLCGKKATGIWLLQVKNGHGTYKLARGWALGIATDTDAIMVAPGIVDPNDPAAAMSIDLRVTEDDATTGFGKIECVTTASNGRSFVPNTTVGDLIMALGDSGMYFCTLRNGRGTVSSIRSLAAGLIHANILLGLRYWLCAAVFLLYHFIQEPTGGDYLCQRAVSVTRRCDTGSSTMENMSIEKGNYDMSKLSEEAKAALLLCDREIRELRRREGL
ncbi:hypothetical protein F4824DRAFT_476356 [Ustulina deusta]|nr:hypothetical protein F4823DRAFT_620144 [Ustulina deusta]KAI3331011.1 hypothetical protein F4824DRAFT_476356 [Ustulina deusta]